MPFIFLRVKGPRYDRIIFCPSPNTITLIRPRLKPSPYGSVFSAEKTFRVTHNSGSRGKSIVRRLFSNGYGFLFSRHRFSFSVGPSSRCRVQLQFRNNNRPITSSARNSHRQNRIPYVILINVVFFFFNLLRARKYVLPYECNIHAPCSPAISAIIKTGFKV